MNKSYLAQQLLTLDPGRSQARQCFYHYIKNLCDLESPLEVSDFDAFYDLAMTYHHWGSSREKLGEVIAGDLVALSKRYSLRFDPGDIVHPHQVQWLVLDREEDFQSILEDENKSYEKSHFDSKLIRLDDGKFLRIRLNRETGGLVAEVKINLAYVDGVRLRLVRPITKLTYGPDLEFAEGVLQMVRVNGMDLASFKSVKGQLQGFHLTGHTLAKGPGVCAEFRVKDELCRVIKTLESHFINPVSDYDYQELVHRMREAITKLKNLQSDGYQKGVEALRIGRAAQQDLFPNDKLLHSLVTSLEYYTQTRRQGDLGECQEIRPLRR